MNTTLQKNIRDAIRCALESSLDPAMAAADWLARDIDPACRSAADLLTNPKVSLEDLQKAKSVYKTMRILGETPADRRVAARYYAAAIAAGLVRHGTRISRQSTGALRRAMAELRDDERMPDRLRALGTAGLRAFDEQGP